MIPIRAELVDNHYVCGGITARSLGALCAALIKAGHAPSLRLEAYRGEILCLRVRALGEVVALGEASPVDEDAPPASGQPSPGITHGRPSLRASAGSESGGRTVVWDGDRLKLPRSGRLVAEIERVEKWPGLWRVRLADGHVTDMTNHTRAREAATLLAMAGLNRILAGAEAA